MKHAHARAQEAARPKLRPWCDLCKNIFSPSARKAGFTVCINCRKNSSWTLNLKTSRSASSQSLPSL